MSGIIEFTVRLIRAGKRSYERKWGFLGVFVVVLFVSTVLLASLDLLPGAPPVPPESQTVVAHVVARAPTAPELPTKITIPAIGLSATIANPTATDVSVLDNALLRGAVRYPTSALLGEEGNLVLFGHSSYLPVVGNQAYKTFNGIQKLSVGDAIIVSSLGMAYTYRVKSVSKESANNAAIPLSVTGRLLTLSTCDSFAAKTDRFVVVADFVESHPIPL